MSVNTLRLVITKLRIDSRYVPYKAPHSRRESRVRVIRQEGHNTRPNIVGPMLPRNDDPERRSFYCASVLMLLKPWRDLHLPNQTWEDALLQFLMGSTTDVHRIIILSSGV